MEKIFFTREIVGFYCDASCRYKHCFSKDLYDNKILIGEQITIIQEAERFISISEHSIPRII